MGEGSFKKRTDEISDNNPLVAKYLLVMVDQGMTSMVNYFHSLEEAEKVLNRITNDLSSKPGPSSGSDYKEISLWEWTKGKYEKVYLYT